MATNPFEDVLSEPPLPTSVLKRRKITKPYAETRQSRAVAPMRQDKNGVWQGDWPSRFQDKVNYRRRSVKDALTPEEQKVMPSGRRVI